MRNFTMAVRLVEALCDAPLEEWRRAAMAAAADPVAGVAATALDDALPSADRARLWDLHDDLETALFRLSAEEAIGIAGGRRACECMRRTASRAVEALVCADALSPEHLAALTRSFLRLIPPAAAGRRDGDARARGR